MMIMPGPSATDTPEKDLMRVVDSRWFHFDDRINSKVGIALMLLLSHGLTAAERITAKSMEFAILALCEIWCRGIFPSIRVDTTSALEDKVIFSNFGDQMLPSAARTDAVLVVGQRAPLAVDHGPLDMG